MPPSNRPPAGMDRHQLAVQVGQLSLFHSIRKVLPPDRFDHCGKGVQKCLYRSSRHRHDLSSSQFRPRHTRFPFSGNCDLQRAANAHWSVNPVLAAGTLLSRLLSLIWRSGRKAGSIARRFGESEGFGGGGGHCEARIMGDPWEGHPEDRKTAGSPALARSAR
jgi:hypothetical protein